MTIVRGSPFLLTGGRRIAHLRHKQAEAGLTIPCGDQPLATASFFDTNARTGQAVGRTDPATMSAIIQYCAISSNARRKDFNRLNVNKIKLSFKLLYETEFIANAGSSNT